MEQKISRSQAHMLTMTRLLGRIGHNSGFNGGIRTARSLAKRGLLELVEREAGCWDAYIPVATLMNEAGAEWVDSEARQFIRMGAGWAEHFQNTDIKPRYYGARRWHDERVYFLVRHPATGEEHVVFADALDIKW